MDSRLSALALRAASLREPVLTACGRQSNPAL